MKESYRKGIANHPDLESCGCRRKAAVEALTEAQAGWILSCEISVSNGVPTMFRESEGEIMGGAISEPTMNPAQSETPGMSGNFMRENRETPLASGSSKPDRLVKATSYSLSTINHAPRLLTRALRNGGATVRERSSLIVKTL